MIRTNVLWVKLKDLVDKSGRDEHLLTVEYMWKIHRFRHFMVKVSLKKGTDLLPHPLVQMVWRLSLPTLLP